MRSKGRREKRRGMKKKGGAWERWMMKYLSCMIGHLCDFLASADFQLVGHSNQVS